MEDLSLIRLLAISQILVFEEMEAFHQRESIYYEMNFPNLCIKENFCTQCWSDRELISNSGRWSLVCPS